MIYFLWFNDGTQLGGGSFQGDGLSGNVDHVVCRSHLHGEVDCGGLVYLEGEAGLYACFESLNAHFQRISARGNLYEAVQAVGVAFLHLDDTGVEGGEFDAGVGNEGTAGVFDDSVKTSRIFLSSSGLEGKSEDEKGQGQSHRKKTHTTTN